MPRIRRAPEYPEESLPFRVVANTADVPTGEMKTVELDGKSVVIYHVEDVFYATTGLCCHQGGPLGEGLLEDAIVVCPWHAWQFDVATGESVLDPGRRIETYPIHVEDDRVLVDIGES